MTNWGNRHLRNGLLDSVEEKEDYKLFEDHVKTMSLVQHNIQNYEDLHVEIVNKYNLVLPSPVDKFEQLNLFSYLLDNIKRCQYESLTIIQKHAIPVILNNINIMACSQTGSGKTASFLIPIIQNLLKEGPPKMEVETDKYKTRKPILF